MSATLHDSGRFDDSELLPPSRRSADRRTGAQLQAERETLRAVLSWAGTVLLFALLCLGLSGCACSFERDRLESDLRHSQSMRRESEAIAATTSASADARALAGAMAEQWKLRETSDARRLEAQK